MSYLVNRRSFVLRVAALAGHAEAIHLCGVAGAQTLAAPKRIGVLLVLSSRDSRDVRQFEEGLAAAGYVQGTDILIEWRTANGDYNRAAELAADHVRAKVDVIVVESTPLAQAAKRATSTIPIVLVIVSDPVGSELVANLAHPGGNVTGLSLMGTELHIKRLELLKEAFPRTTRVAVLWNPETRWQAKQVEYLRSTASSLNIELTVIGARTASELNAAFERVTREHSQGLLVIGGSPFWNQRTKLVKLAEQAKLPAMYYAREFADEGGLMSYGANYGDLYRRASGFVDRIFKGAKPGDLPIEQPTKFELVVNLRAAKAIGISIPESILLRADEVIR